jgi:histone acetyltransferase (RNA polymerase elongator complex component)
MIIPFFIPHSGCPHQCVFCNQKNITGQAGPAGLFSVPRKISAYLNTGSSNKPVDIAFYGGSFTALPIETQKAYLLAVRPFIESGRIKSIRCSTRPDCIDSAGLTLLHEYQVDIVELGAQSMEDRVLALSGRGHTSMDTRNAVTLLRERGFTIGLQLMPGLPGDSPDCFSETVDQVIALRPDFVRLYPTLVIKGTPLEELYKAGRYAPLSLDEAVSQCSEAYVKFKRAGIEVVRMGLQPTEELEKPGTILAGPFHPAFRQLVESALMLDMMRSALRKRRKKTTTAVFCVSPRDVSAAIGQRKENIKALKKEFGLREVRIVKDNEICGRGEPVLLDN